ncbi:hypothetical protein M197_gp84 [Haloarcula hispanica tailed virus 2]|uniref:Uncharacterized protein n=1 Tax=Haloarcula hispanica tailed virus 2 TaxID=1273751 RepID=R4TM57_9CAUD|nr:hypothetical protein M197_gp84 [Haloarcula hispanica tailed virus 2]AGM11248.1 hypothetical protein HHTV2_84 [Haloarcula hispanica tailed virus 2]
MPEGPDYYVNSPPGDLKAHIFRGEDVRRATLVDGTTDEPVASICGTVRAYGPFSEWGEGEVCGNCTNKIADSER